MRALSRWSMHSTQVTPYLPELILQSSWRESMKLLLVRLKMLLNQPRTRSPWQLTPGPVLPQRHLQCRAGCKHLAGKTWVDVCPLRRPLKHPQISKALGAARCLVEHFKRSKLASSKLKTKQKQMGTPEHKLVQDFSTRWNSTYYMMTRLLEQRWPLTATLSDPEHREGNNI